MKQEVLIKLAGTSVYNKHINIDANNLTNIIKFPKEVFADIDGIRIAILREDYENLIKARMLEESKTKSQELKIINQYFFPELFSLIHKKLHLVPLWTGILIKQCQNNMLEKNQIQSTEPFLNITRLTNNPVENYFGHLKNNILMKKKNLMPSEVLGPIYQNLKSKYYQFYDSVSNVQETKLFDRKMNFSDGKDRGSDVVSLSGNDLDKRYIELKKDVRQEIFVGHKVCSPILFGVKTEGQLGGRTEIAEAYELFQNTYVSKKLLSLIT